MNDTLLPSTAIANLHALPAPLGLERWYAVHSKRNDEARAERNVRGYGIETFLPRALIVGCGRSGASRSRVEPLFPGYFFVRCDIVATTVAIRYARGVSKIVCTAQVPTVVDDEIISAIRAKLCADGLVHLAPDLATGERVRITAGPMQDFVGVFQSSLKGSERAVLLLGTLERFRVVVERAALQKVS